MEQGKCKETIHKEAERLPQHNVNSDSDDEQNSMVLQEMMFYTFTRVLTVHQQNLNQIFIINGALSDRYECCSKRYICLFKTMVTHRHVTNAILTVHI